MKTAIPILALLALLTLPARGQEADDSGAVQLPLEIYDDLVQQAADPEAIPVPAPASYALGDAQVQVTVDDTGARATGVVTVELEARILVDEWTLVPLLGTGTAVSSARVDGGSVQLISSPAGLGWSARTPGTYHIELVYSVDATRSDQGLSLALPIPQAAVTSLIATLPGSGLDVAVLPAAGVSTAPGPGGTVVTATIPTSSGIHLSWRVPGGREHAVSRATYTGRLAGDAVVWSADLDVKLFDDETVPLSLLPKTVTLNEVEVDGEPATIVANESGFVAMVRGAGAHRISLGFEVPVTRADGPPQVELSVPEIPVSRFELVLPGKKEVSVQPVASVTHTTRGDSTVATAHVPLTSTVVLSWSEAVPEEIRAELRTNADIYHAVHAEEGVLYVHAMMALEVTRGETNQLEIEMPPDAVVNDIRAESGGVAEWSPRPAKRGSPYRVSVFLDRQIRDKFVFDILYERKLGTGDAATEPVTVPLVRAVDVNRQRGMVALLAGKEFTLEPVDEEPLTRVGENQLPHFVRNAVDKTIAHTFKYAEEPPGLQVEPAIPERKEGKFDARVDTLISLGDVTLRGSASVEIDLKSGGIAALELELPAGVDLLNLSAPSLRDYHVLEGDDGVDVIEVEFTQEMDGQFRLEVVYEQITADGATEIVAPLLKVRGAEVEQGRIGVEALCAVEVQASTLDHLSSLDTGELPQQLILRTTNPILLAFKYVQADPPARLGLDIARHREIDVQGATIDRAVYRTLYTRDGLAVTTATFTVRNSRKQFLKVELPRGSEVWSVFVDGRAEKPALVGPQDSDQEIDISDVQQILVKITNSTQGFPVEIIYATDIPRIGAVGKVRGQLPRPDMVVTNSRWDVYLPDDVAFGTPRTNMDVVEEAAAVSAGDMLAGAPVASGLESGPLRIDVPTAGIRYSFEKVYANRSDEDAGFTLPYSSAGGVRIARMISLLGTVVLWIGIFVLVRRILPAKLALPAIGTAVVLLGVSIGSLGAGLVLPLVVSGILLLGYAIRPLLALIAERRKAPAGQPDPTGDPA